MKPYLETAFRRPRLFILPALVLSLLTIAALVAMPSKQSTTATLWVDVAIEEQFSSSSDVLTASEEEARAFTDRLNTLAFRRQVLVDAGLAPLIESLEWPAPSAPGTWLASQGLPFAGRFGGAKPADVDTAWTMATDHVLKSITVTPKGENLVQVTYTGSDATNAQKLVEAATNNYLKEKAAAAQRKVDESNRVHDPIIAALTIEVEQARQAWANFTASLPPVPTAVLASQAAELEKTYRDGAERLEQLKLSRASATLSALAEWTNKSANVTLVDAPDEPSSSVGPISIAKFAIFAAMVGAGIGGVLVVFRTWMSREIRIPEDIETRLEIPVIAVLPLVVEAGRGRRNGR